jgi:CxxC-x17-CxxC domain-containing protein
MTKEDSPSQETSTPENNDASADESTVETPPTGEDQTLDCVQCGSQFVFSKEEQEFFATKGLHAPPKRCKACRAERRKSRRSGRRGRSKDYRGPGFRDKRGGDRTYRSPAFQSQQDVNGIYRSPAFQDRPDDTDDSYRAPAFQGQDESFDEIYRAPAFQKALFEEEIVAPVVAAEGAGAEVEHDLELGPPPGFYELDQNQYRSPAFADTDPSRYSRQRERHEIVCADCGRKSTVPFKPRKDRPVFCKECFAKKR